MELDLAALPLDVDALHRLIQELSAKQTTERKALTEAQAEIERLRLIVQKLQRQQFGRRAERLDEGQLELGLEDVGSDIGRVEQLLPMAPAADDAVARERSDRPSLPEHLEREELNLSLDMTACPCCGGALHAIGDTVSEMLDWVPGRLRVIRRVIGGPNIICRDYGIAPFAGTKLPSARSFNVRFVALCRFLLSRPPDNRRVRRHDCRSIGRLARRPLSRGRRISWRRQQNRANQFRGSRGKST